MSENEKNVSVRGLSHVFKNFCTWLNSQLSPVAKSGDYNDLINAPDIHVNNNGSLYVKRDTDGSFFKFTHTEWSTSGSDAWGGMYFETSDDLDVFGFAARQTSFPLPGEGYFAIGNNGYLRGYDTNGSRSVTLVINGGTANQPDTQNITVDGTFVNAGNQRPFSANTYTIGTPDMPYKSMCAKTFVGNVTGNASTATTATKALKDGNGAVIANTYVTKTELASKVNDIMTQCPTPPEGDSSNKLATTEWVQNELAKLRQALRDIQNPENPENP